MGNSWYKKSMPKIATVKSNIKDMASHIIDIEGVKSVRVFGSFIKHANSPNYALKDIDLIAVTNIFSEDLISITDDDIYSPFNLTTAQLEDDGFDPKAVNFTKKFIKLKDYNIDHWAISSDKKILHWGSSIENKQDWDEIKIEAERYAENQTNLDRKKLSYANQKQKDNWSMLYDHYISKYMSNVPEGWFLSDCNIDDVLKESKKII